MSNNQPTPGDTTPHQTIHMDTDTASDSEPHLPTAGAHLHTYISVDTDSEDGGMQLEPADGEMLHFAEDDSDIEFDERIMGVAMEEDRDENDFTTRAVNPHSAVPNAHNTPSQPGNRDDPSLGFYPPRERHRATRPRRLRTDGHLSEEQHAALAVLSNWELLVTHALNSHRTIPQTRRRFQAKLLAPNNPGLENDLYASRFVVPASESELLPPAGSFTAAGGATRGYETASGADNTTAFLVPGSYREVVDGDERSWWPMGKPRVKRKSDRGVSGRGREGSGGSGESSRVGSRGGSRAVSTSR
ncbi:hypothetical protein PMG11_00146 [Penicillium brasilianum]|uniref:Uncharacterized protein n=1 Tax=Penicillium brasilianum TaxID=104259 RepID=A0A0F7TBJ7_PENBI|nr:hypothetical protein PMG11_00146 [Penicillium brasilianum]